MILLHGLLYIFQFTIGLLAFTLGMFQLIVQIIPLAAWCGFILAIAGVMIITDGYERFTSKL